MYIFFYFFIMFQPSKTVEELVLVTLRGDVTEQYQLMLRAMVVSE